MPNMGRVREFGLWAAAILSASIRVRQALSSQDAALLTLGVALEEHAQGVRIADVTAGSLAEQTGLRRDDIVTEVAGKAAKRPLHLIAAVRTQPGGTWLPLKLQRSGESIEVVVRFPVER